MVSCSVKPILLIGLWLLNMYIFSSYPQNYAKLLLVDTLFLMLIYPLKSLLLNKPCSIAIPSFFIQIPNFFSDSPVLLIAIPFLDSYPIMVSSGDPSYLKNLWLSQDCSPGLFEG